MRGLSLLRLLAAASRPSSDAIGDPSLAAAHAVAGRLMPAFAIVATVFCASGLAVGFFGDPGRAVDDDTARILYLHRPAFWVALLLHLGFVGWALLASTARHRLAAMAARALLPTAMLFAFLSIWTGSLGAKPFAGSWWIWEPRSAVMALLLSSQLAWLLMQSVPRPRDGPSPSSAVIVLAGLVLALTAGVTLPVPAVAATLTEASPMSPGMLATMLGFWAYAVAIGCWRLRTSILEVERQSAWVAGVVARRA